jgi:hypothetical protein
MFSRPCGTDLSSLKPLGYVTFRVAYLSPATHALSSPYREKEILNLSPAGNTTKTGDLGVVGSAKENSLALESLKVAVGIVDQVVGEQNALVSAKDEMGRWDKGKVTP